MSDTSHGVSSQPHPTRNQEAEPRTDTFYVPERSIVDWGVAVLLSVLSAVYLWPFRDFATLNADEGIVLQGAQRILEGELPYRDFFSFYTPGSYYWMALFLKIFGNSYLVGRTLLVVYGGLFSVLAYFIARRVCPRAAAILAAYLLLVICLPYRFVILHNWDSTLWAFLALYCAVWILHAPHPAWSFALGGFTALCLMFEQSKGVGLLVGLALGFSILGLQRPLFRHRIRGPAVAALLGFVWPFLLAFAYMAYQGNLSEMLSSWLWPLQHYSAVNRTAYGYHTIAAADWEALYADPSWVGRLSSILILSPLFLIPMLPFLAAAFMAVHSIRIWRGNPEASASGYFVLVGAVATGLTLSVLATGRPDLTHLIYIAPPLFPVLAWITCVRPSSFLTLARMRPLVVVYLVVFFTGLGLVFLWQPRDAHILLRTRRGVLRCRVRDAVVEYVQEHVPAGGKIFVYPYQPLYYYLTGTSNPTRYEYLQPGMHTASQFQEALRELAADRTQVVIFDINFVGEKVPAVWPATPGNVSDSDPLTDYIFAEYRPCRSLTSTSLPFVFMVRKDLQCPKGGSVP